VNILDCILYLHYTSCIAYFARCSFYNLRVVLYQTSADDDVSAFVFIPGRAAISEGEFMARGKGCFHDVMETNAVRVWEMEYVLGVFKRIKNDFVKKV